MIGIQETKVNDPEFPVDEIKEIGYHPEFWGQKGHYGVAILSKVGIEDVVAGFSDGGDPDPDARIIWATCGGVRVASAYIPNGREVGHEHYAYKLSWLARLKSHLELNHDPKDSVAVLGDFNVAPEDKVVWDPKAFKGATHVSKPERDAFEKILEWGRQDVFRNHYPSEEGLYTFWEYMAGRFHKREGMRIDFILATKSLSTKCKLVFVDRNARKGEKPSDHAPLLAELV